MSAAEPARVWTSLPDPEPAQPVEMDSTALALASALDSLIALGCATKPRALQRSVGASEIGSKCDRQISYALHGVPATNYRDPLRTLVGEEFHLALGELFTRLNSGSARWLIETPIIYKNLPGTVDLYDRHTATVIDWKTSTKDKIRRVRREGIPLRYKVQLQIYAAGLAALGETPRRVAVVYIPMDGELSDLWAWVSTVDEQQAIDAIERKERLELIPPERATAKPDRLCPWCNHYRPGSTDLALGCPGNIEGK